MIEWEKGESLNKIPQQNLKQICKYLDKNDRWKTMLQVLNKKYDELRFVKTMSPALAFMTNLIEDNMLITDFVDALQKLRYEPPLMLFKKIENAIIIKQPPKELIINTGDCITIECLATGFPHPNYQWFKKQDILPEQSSCKLSFKNVQFKDEGVYICRVHNSGFKNCVFSNWCTIKVKNLSPVLSKPQIKQPSKPPRITRHPIANIEVTAGSSFSLNCLALGIPNVFFQWYKNGNSLEGEIYPNFQLGNANASHIGTYQCKVYNDAGTVWSCQSQVKILEENLESVSDHVQKSLVPEIIYHPQTPSEKVSIGSSIILACKANGKPPLRYEWYKNNKIIAGVETNELKFLNIQSNVENGGSYQCRVYNAYGSILSRPANIKLDLASDINQLTATDKIAVLIGNYAYSASLSPLATVQNDLRALTNTLSDMGFKIFSFTNLSYYEIHSEIDEFCRYIHSTAKGSRIYFVFYFGGHGFEKHGKSYLVPLPHKISPNEKLTQHCPLAQGDLKNQSICVETDILQRLNSRTASKRPALIVFLLDICRIEENGDDIQELSYKRLPLAPNTSTHPPHYQNNYSPAAGETIINCNNDDSTANQPTNNTDMYDSDIGGNYIYGYATSVSNRAFEMEGQTHSIFITHLLKYISRPLPIEDVLRQTRLSVFATEPLAKSNSQYPEIRSNLSKNFSLTDKIV